MPIGARLLQQRRVEPSGSWCQQGVQPIRLADPQGRADVDRWLHWQSCHLMPAMGALKTADDKEVGAYYLIVSPAE